MNSRATISSLKATHTAHRMASDIGNPLVDVTPIPQPDPNVPIDFVLPPHPVPLAELKPLKLPWLRRAWEIHGEGVIMAAVIIVTTAVLLMILRRR